MKRRILFVLLAFAVLAPSVSGLLNAQEITLVNTSGKSGSKAAHFITFDAPGASCLEVHLEIADCTDLRPSILKGQ